MYHPFSIAETVKTAWNVLKKNFVPLIVYSAISFFIKELVGVLKDFLFIGDDRLSVFITFAVQMLIQSYLALSFYKLILTLMDKEYYEFEFKQIIPSFRMTFNFILIALAYSILVVVLYAIDLFIKRNIAEYDTLLSIYKISMSLLILYLLLRSIFCICFIVDDDSNPVESLRQSFEATKDNFFKTLFIFFLVIIILIAGLVPMYAFVILSGIDPDKGESIVSIFFYIWVILAFPAVQVIIMVTYRKLVYSHQDVDDDFAETN